MKITFFGTRGSCPCAGDHYQKFGGNTSCVLVETDERTPLILDAGTGLRALGSHLHDSWEHDEPFRARLLLTHLHYDHLLGLPFFRPLEQSGSLLEIYGPRQGDGDLASVIDAAVTPPFFPVQMKEFRGDIQLVDVGDEELTFGSTTVMARFIPHTGATLGFRSESNGRSMAYLPDHQAPLEGDEIAAAVRELIDGVDLLIHDAQYDEEEFAEKSNWGHSTIRYALEVAHQGNVGTLALFHHDPAHDDDRLAALEHEAQVSAQGRSIIQVLSAREGMSIELSEQKDA